MEDGYRCRSSKINQTKGVRKGKAKENSGEAIYGNTITEPFSEPEGKEFSDFKGLPKTEQNKEKIMYFM